MNVQCYTLLGVTVVTVMNIQNSAVTAGLFSSAALELFLNRIFNKKIFSLKKTKKNPQKPYKNPPQTKNHHHQKTNQPTKTKTNPKQKKAK